MAMQTVSVPSSLFTGNYWKQWGIFAGLDVVGIGTTTRQNQPGTLFPKDYLPSSPVWIAEGIDDTSAELFVDGSNSGILVLLAVMGGGFAPGVTTAFLLTNRRVGSAHQGVLPSGVPYRIGFSIENAFKHQAYMGYTVIGAGWEMVGLSTWLLSSGWGFIDYTTNCRFNKALVQHGKVYNTRYVPSLNKFYIKLYDGNTSLANFTPGGQFVIYATIPAAVGSGGSSGSSGSSSSAGSSNIGKTITEVYDVGTLNGQGEIEYTDLAGSAGSPSVWAEAGDFFVLTKPWVVQDPALFHEYGLTTKSYNKPMGISGSISGTGGTTGSATFPSALNYFKTQRQPPIVTPKVIGFFYPFPQTTTSAGSSGSGGVTNSTQVIAGNMLYQGYADDADQSLIWLPQDIGQQARYLTSMWWSGSGGQWKDGWNQWYSDKTADSVRIILDLTAQDQENFAAGNLVGEFIRFDKQASAGSNGYGGAALGAPPYWFEIINHPRVDAIDIDMKCINQNGVNALSCLAAINNWNQSAPSPIPSDFRQSTLLQQKFWMINELYPGTGYGCTGLYQNLTSGVSSGSTGSSGTGYAGVLTYASWTGNEVLQTKLTMATEVVETGCKTLDERLWRLDFSSGGSGGSGGLALSHIDCAIGFKKFDNWKIYQFAGNSYYPATFKIAPSSNVSSGIRSWDIHATVYGDITQKLGAGGVQGNGSAGLTAGSVYVVMGEPYRVHNGGYSTSNNYIYLQSQVAKTENEQWAIYNNGYYDCGSYDFSPEISDNAVVTLVDYSYGTTLGGGVGHPELYATTHSTNPTIALCEHPSTGRAFLFFNDSQYNSALVFRSGNLDWASNLQQQVVRIGYPTTLGAWGSSGISAGSSGSPYLYTKMYFNMTPESVPSGSNPPFFKNYWLRQGANYFESSISGQGGVNTPLSRRYGISNSSSVDPIYLPYEYYSPVGNSSTKVPTEAVAYGLASQSFSSIGLEEVTNRSSVNNVMLGINQTSSATLAYSLYAAEVASSSQLILGSGFKDVIFMPDGTMFLFYGANYPSHIDPIDSTKTWSAGVGLFMVHSTNEGNDWGSPRLVKPPDPNSIDGQEWSRPLLLQREFKYAGISFNPKGEVFNIFGYVYYASKTGYIPALGLGLYSVSFACLGIQTTYPLIDIKSNQVFAYYRDPQVNQYKWVTATGSSGIIWGLVGDERFCIPFGNSGNYSALVKDSMDPLRDTDSIAIASGGDSQLAIYLKNNNDGTLFKIVSKDGGFVNWGIELSDGTISTGGSSGGRSVYAAGGAAPSIFQNNLFYFLGTDLYFQDANLTGQWLGSQQTLNGIPKQLVASGLTQQKVVARENHAGDLEVYYVRNNGQIGMSYSTDGGYQWKVLSNW